MTNSAAEVGAHWNERSRTEICSLPTHQTVGIIAARAADLLHGGNLPHPFRSGQRLVVTQGTQEEQQVLRLRAIVEERDPRVGFSVNQSFVGMAVPDDTGKIYIERYSPFPGVQETYSIDTRNPKQSRGGEWKKNGWAASPLPLGEVLGNVAAITMQLADPSCRKDYEDLAETEAQQDVFLYPALQGPPASAENAN